MIVMLHSSRDFWLW